MKKIARIFAVVVVVALLSASSVWAGNDKRRGTAGAPELLINPWAGSTGWGGVDIANVRGLQSFYSNVAGLAFIAKNEVAYSNAMYLGGTSKLTGGASINAFGLGVRVFESGVLAVHVMSMGFGQIDVTTVGSPDGGNGTFSPSFMNINIAYSHSFTNSIHGGMNIKIITEQTADVNASGFAIDAGIQYVTGENDELKFGISLKNWAPAMSFGGPGLSRTTIDDAGNTVTLESRSAEMELPTCLNIGISYDFLFEQNDQKITLAGAFTSNAFLRDNFTFGAQYSLLNMFQVRCAYVYQTGLWSGENRATANMGICGGASVTVPLGKKSDKGSTPDLTVDYSYRHANPLRGTHTIGASLRF
ncbi:MAG: PorV/PorQ family protein [Bacteroidales bacterium]|nr:PorV/PorQ family protein [Bacteroidales bacterium]